jgi:hypothetical protein
VSDGAQLSGAFQPAMFTVQSWVHQREGQMRS